jgi:hypothetical protein
MAKNKLSDLNDHLFMALERLNDEELSSEQIESESKRAEAIIGVANQIIGNAKITLDAMRLVSNGNLDITELPETFSFKRLSLGSTQNGR